MFNDMETCEKGKENWVQKDVFDLNSNKYISTCAH